MDISGLLKLKSGTDVRGVAVGSENSPVTLTDQAVYAIVRSFCAWLAERVEKSSYTVAVGNDVRISTERILKATVKALSDSGVNCVYTGLSSTPSMFMLLHDGWNCDASIMITASHLPYDRNGLKFFTPEGGLGGEDITRILERAAKLPPVSQIKASYTEKSYMDDYCRSLVESVRKGCGKKAPLSGKKIIVDAGNGAGGFFAEKVLIPLGADTSGSINLRPDGTFPNHIPNPEDKEAVNALKQAVLSEGADLGIIFDTDVDRAGAVDKNGAEINRNRLIALLSAILLKDKKGTIVTDSVTSDGLTIFINSLGGKHIRFKRGYKNVIDEAIRRNGEGEYCPLAIETSGHAAFKDNYFLDDGAYLITRLLICLSKQAEKGLGLTSLISEMPVPAEEDEVRITFGPLSENFKSEGLQVIEDIKAKASSIKGATLAPDNYEGVKVSFDRENGDGWFLVRLSVHDPILPINFESNKRGGDKIIADRLLKLLKPYPFLNTEKLEKFIQQD